MQAFSSEDRLTILSQFKKNVKTSQSGFSLISHHSDVGLEHTLKHFHIVVCKIPGLTSNDCCWWEYLWKGVSMEMFSFKRAIFRIAQTGSKLTSAIIFRWGLFTPLCHGLPLISFKFLTCISAHCFVFSCAPN